MKIGWSATSVRAVPARVATDIGEHLNRPAARLLRTGFTGERQSQYRKGKSQKRPRNRSDHHFTLFSREVIA